MESVVMNTGQERATRQLASQITADVREIIDRVGEPLNRLSGKRILVTGASGFLCSYFVDTIAAFNELSGREPAHITALDNFKVGLPERLAHLLRRSDVEFLQRDVSQPLDIPPVDYIIHGASIASPVFYRQYPLETISANVNGTWQLLEFSRKNAVQSILYLSTSEIYGDPDPEFIPTSEDYRGKVSCTGPRACYDESKRLAETLCATYYSVYHTPVNVVRPFNVYGPGQRLDDGRIIPDLISAAIRRQPILLYSDGRATRSFCYITDAVSAMLLVLLSQSHGEIFNVGNDSEEISINEAAKRLQAVAGSPLLEIQHAKSVDAHFVTDNPQRRFPDLTHLRRSFPWQPQVDLTEGLARTLRANRDRTEASTQFPPETGSD